MYKDFLEKLTPQEWKDENLPRKSLKVKAKEGKVKSKSRRVSGNFYVVNWSVSKLKMYFLKHIKKVHVYTLYNFL